MLPLVVGGTGLYLRALRHGLFDGPARDEALRRRLEVLAARFGVARLHRLLARVDPAAAGRIEPQDLVRTVRALEVYRTTGRSISAQQAAGASAARGLPLAAWSAWRRTAVCCGERVERRTREMLGGGLLDEVRASAVARLSRRSCGRCRRSATGRQSPCLRAG